MSNTLLEHLINVCHRNRLAPTVINMMDILADMDDESIMEVINSKDTLDITIKYGIVDVDVNTMPPGLMVKIKDYDVQPEVRNTEEDVDGPFFIHEFQRSK